MELPLTEKEMPPETQPVRRGGPMHHAEGTTGLSGESRILHAALEQMNVRGDATSALAELDSYGSKYPSGVLAREADVARVDALLRLGREADALALLDGAAVKGFEGYPRPGQLRVLRGELLARLGRCDEAIPIFTSALADPQAGQSAERALYGRAHCRATLGEMTESRSDLDRYLALYPEGHFAAEARRALAK
jgi:tetratricopeptide (TPR) repeat protein